MLTFAASFHPRSGALPIQWFGFHHSSSKSLSSPHPISPQKPYLLPVSTTRGTVLSFAVWLRPRRQETHPPSQPHNVLTHMGGEFCPPFLPAKTNCRAFIRSVANKFLIHIFSFISYHLISLGLCFFPLQFGANDYYYYYYYYVLLHFVFFKVPPPHVSKYLPAFSGFSHFPQEIVSPRPPRARRGLPQPAGGRRALRRATQRGPPPHPYPPIWFGGSFRSLQRPIKGGGRLIIGPWEGG